MDPLRSSPQSRGGLGSSILGSFGDTSPLQHAATHLSYSSCPSLTGELLRQAISEFLRTQVAHVTQVVVLYGFNNHDFEPDEEIPITQGKFCYVALTQCELILIDRTAVGQLSLSAIAPSYEEIMKTSNAGQDQMVYCVPFHVLSKIRVDSDREDQCSLLLRDDRGPGFPPCFVLSTVHRKSLCEQLTALYNAHFEFAAMMPEPSAAISAVAQAALMAHAQVSASHIYSTQGVGTDVNTATAADPLLSAGGVLSMNRFIPNNRFSVITTSSNHSSIQGRIRKLTLAFQDTHSSFKHPAEQFFHALPSKYRGQIFHRCGYMFCTRRIAKSGPGYQMSSGSSGNGVGAPGGPSAAAAAPGLDMSALQRGEWIDQAALFLNRPTATYRFVSQADQEFNLPLHQRKFLTVSFCQEKPISPFSNVVKSRDLRGATTGRAAGKSTLKELLRGRDDCDDDDFFMWSESVGRAVAMNECRLAGCSDFFVPQSLVHTKKMNPVGDKASWMCFKIHIYTPYRELGLITCRRKCLPPYFDTFQDMVFVLYGSCLPNNAPLIPGIGNEFMEELEMLVDSLSPTVVPLPYHYAKGLSLAIIHPTYADTLVNQGRVNSLLNNSMAYHWLSTRPWISSAGTAGLTKGEMGIFPTTEFLGQACFKLAKSFANSILVRVTHRRERLVWAEFLPVAVEGIGAESVDDGSNGLGMHSGGPQGGGGGGGGSGSGSGGGGSGGQEEEKEQDGGGGKEGGAKGGDADASFGGSGEEGASLSKQLLVADPMVIVSRMLTEFAASEAATRRKLGPQRSTYSAEEEWRCRVSQYLAYCVDDGIFPGALNIKRLLSVLTRAFLDAPILSAETSMKLDRVVDFLLYMKRRCGPPISLPSWSHAHASVTAAHKLKRQGLTIHHHKHHHHHHRQREEPIGPKSATAEATNSHSPFASLSAQSPSALFVEASEEEAGWYDYDESSTLLQKLRDSEMLANFTCNEHIMIPLLDTSYIESLEKATIGTAQQVEGSVIPALLASLLTKDYNVDLIRAVRDKIIAYEIHDISLIPPLIALMKDGTLQTSQYALHALTMLAKFHPDEVIAAGGASMPMWFIFMSKNELLLSASIDLILVLFTDATRSIFAQPSFAMKLVDLLRRRVGGARYQNIVLQKTALLMFKLAMLPELLHIFLAQYAHRELVQIIGEYEKKRPILLETSACLGQLFVHAKNKMLGTPSENARSDASIIVQTMARCTTKSQLRICLNLLLALQILIRLPKAYYTRLNNTTRNAKGEVVFTQPDKSFASRIQVLQHLHTTEGLENVLDRGIASAESEVSRCLGQLRTMNAVDESIVNGVKRTRILAPEGDTSDPLSAGARTLELIEQHTIATNVMKVAAWFKKRMSLAVTAKWNVNMIWQKDDQHRMLGVPAKE